MGSQTLEEVFGCAWMLTHVRAVWRQASFSQDCTTSQGRREEMPMPSCALMWTTCSTVFLSEGEQVMKSFLAKFSDGSSDINSFRYCGKQFERGSDNIIKVDTADNTRKIHGANVGSRLGSERLLQEDITKLRSITGSLAWISRQTRPDLGYRVSRLQSSIKDATVSTLTDANAVVVLAHKGHDVKLCFPAAHLRWNEVGVITVTDASFSNEKNYKSQQGRIHFLGDLKQIKDERTTTYKVMPLSFGSTTIKRVCRSTLQAETYALQNGLETGDKLRGVIAEIKGKIRSLKTWEEDSRSCIPHLAMTDCSPFPFWSPQSGSPGQGKWQASWDRVAGYPREFVGRRKSNMDHFRRWRRQVDLDCHKHDGGGLLD